MLRTKWIIQTILLAATLGLSQPAYAEDKTITIVADEWCPYNCAENAKNPGYMVEIAREVFKKSGIKVIYKVMPWSDAIKQTRAGNYDGIVGATFNDAPDFVFPEVLQGISPFKFWVNKDSTWRYTGLDSLAGVRLGVVTAVSYGKAIDAYLAAHKDELGKRIMSSKTDNSSAENIQTLMAGKLDAIIEDQNVVTYYFASQNNPRRIKSAGTPIDNNHIKDLFLHVAFSPQNPQSKIYAKLLAKGVVDMRESGELRTILSKYNVNDFYRYIGNQKEARNVPPAAHP